MAVFISDAGGHILPIPKHEYPPLHAKNRHLFWNSHCGPIWRITLRPIFWRSIMWVNLEILARANE